MIKYISSQGREIDLSSFKTRLKDAVFHAYSWNYESTEQKYGIEINGFRKDPLEYDLEIWVRGANTEKKKTLNELTDQAEYDVVNKTPGKLILGDYYLTCYILTASTEPGDYATVKTMQILAPYPFWIRETTYSFLAEAADPITILPGEEEPEPEITMEQGIMFTEFPFDLTVREGKKTKGIFDLPTDLKRVRGTRMINNESYLPCHFRMTIYGPVTDPEIVIANHIYKVETTVFTDERLEIDSRSNTVIKIGRLGEETDLYNSRYKLQSVFEKIPPGQQTVTWPGGYGIDIVLFDERSEPKWSS